MAGQLNMTVSGSSDRETRLSFVLPVATQGTGRDHCDLARARRLCVSLERFFDLDCLETVVVVTPLRDLAATHSALAPFNNSLRMQIVSETDFCPILASNPQTLNIWPRPNLGWFRQQLIKLAAHTFVTTPFYMTLDADVIFVRPFSASTLIRDGRALLATLTAEDLKGLFRQDVASHEIVVRNHRVAQAEATLQLMRPEGLSEFWYGETPAILARNIVAEMASHLENIWGGDWQEVLLSRIPWTEYALYGLFAEVTGQLETYHRRGGMNAVLRLSHSLWRPSADYLIPRDLENWDVERVFESDADGVAVVVQSYLGYELEVEDARIGARLFGGMPCRSPEKR